MGVRQREWAKRARVKLIEQLGGRCAQCGSLKDLELDHLYPSQTIINRPWNKRQDSSHRISILRREAKEGLLQVLCSECNKRKGEPGDA